MQKPIILLDNDVNTIDKTRLFVAIMPCIFAELAIIFTANQKWILALILLMIGFATTLFLERNVYLPTEQPPGYRAIRWLTTLIIQICLFGAIIFRVPW